MPRMAAWLYELLTADEGQFDTIDVDALVDKVSSMPDSDAPT